MCVAFSKLTAAWTVAPTRGLGTTTERGPAAGAAGAAVSNPIALIVAAGNAALLSEG